LICDLNKMAKQPEKGLILENVAGKDAAKRLVKAFQQETATVNKDALSPSNHEEIMRSKIKTLEEMLKRAEDIKMM
jgi:hypothetical protein